MLISGWKDADIKADIKDETLKEDFKDSLNKNSDFYCLEFQLNNSFTKEKIETLINECLNLFEYINVVLIGKDEKKYQARIKSKGLKISIKKLSEEVKKLEEIEEELPLNYCRQNVTKRYLWPGIEILNESEGIKEEIVRKLNDVINDSLDFFDLDHLHNSISKHFFHHPNRSFPLPILLQSDKKMSTYEDIWNIKKKCDKELLDKYVSKVKPLAYYSRGKENDSIGCRGPHIVLCPSRIKETASSLKIDTGKYLIVLIHEFAHAMMDKNRAKGTLKSIFAHAMEESLANMITLQWFEKYDNKNLQNAMDFMSSQPIVYQFGIKQFYAKVDWKKWRDSEKNMHGLRD